MLLSLSGSSPRIRGKRFPEPMPTAAPGLIPAHTGKTCRAPGTPLLSRAHPRAYGENESLAYDRNLPLGSSPRIRGKPKAAFSCTQAGGLIPAHTGKTLQKQGSGYGTGAHPRAYGENHRFPCWLLAHLGSSPRIRGKH